MTIAFPNSSPRIPKSGIVFEGADFKYDNSFSKLLPKTLKQDSKNQKLLFLREILLLDKFKDADSKYDNIVFVSQSETTQKRIFCPKFKHFYFCTCSWALISIMTKVFLKL